MSIALFNCYNKAWTDVETGCKQANISASLSCWPILFGCKLPLTKLVIRSNLPVFFRVTDHFQMNGQLQQLSCLTNTQFTFLKKGNEGWRMSDCTRTVLGISGNRSYEVLKTNMKCLARNIVNMHGWGREKGKTVVSTAIYISQWRLHHGLGLHFNQWELGSCQNWWVLNAKRSAFRFWSIMQYHLKQVWVAAA